MPFDRWAALLTAVADELLALMLNRHDHVKRHARFEHFLRAQAIDPNFARIRWLTALSRGGACSLNRSGMKMYSV